MFFAVLPGADVDPEALLVAPMTGLVHGPFVLAVSFVVISAGAAKVERSTGQ